MTDFGRRAGVGDMLKSVYDQNADNVVDSVPAHKTTHQSGQADAINVTGLTGTTPKALLGDATPGRVERSMEIYIMDGSNADTINVSTLDSWNGDTIAMQDNLGHGGDETNYALDGFGFTLTIKAAGLTGNAVAVLCSSITGSTCGTVYKMIATALANNIVILLSHATDGTQVDLAAAVDLGLLSLNITYLTDE